VKYVHGTTVDEPLAVDDGATLSYFHTDGLGSVVRTTDTSGTVTLTRQYDAWGNLQSSGGQPGFAFTGREWEPEVGLYYYRARFYSPEAGRFISEDPIHFEGGEANFYAYVAGNPTSNRDPSGTVIWHVNEMKGYSHGVYPKGYTGIARPRVVPECKKACDTYYLVFHVWATITQVTAAPSSADSAYVAWSQKHEDWHRRKQRDNMVDWARKLRPYEHSYGSEEECKAAAAAAVGQLDKWDPVLNNMDLDTRIMRWIFGIK
jgi:RHS repeat-associated protein